MALILVGSHELSYLSLSGRQYRRLSRFLVPKFDNFGR